MIAACAFSSLGCEEEAAPEPNKPSAPIPTTPPHRRPLRAGQIKRFEVMVAQQLADEKPELTKTCWDPIADAGAPEDGGIDIEDLKEAASGSSVEVQFLFVYGEDGKELSRQVLDHPTKRRAGLSKCLDDTMAPTTIPAQNRKVQIKIPMTFP
jgi:hypothetical protein